VQLKQRLVIVNEKADAHRSAERCGECKVKNAGGKIPDKDFSHGG
jgi:hypothetical protein